MSYIKTNWLDRIVEKPLTFDVVNNPDGSITLVPKPGTITQEGVYVNAARLNKIENALEKVEDVDRIPSVWKAIMRTHILAEAQRYNYEDVLIDSFIDDSAIESLGGWKHDAVNKKMCVDWLNGDIDYSVTGGSSSFKFHSQKYMAQTIECTKKGKLHKISVRASKIAYNGAPNPTFGIAVQIRNLNGSAPGSTILASGVIPTSSFPDYVEGTSNYANADIIFSSPISVNVGDKYSIVCYTEDHLGNDNSCYYIGANGANPYPGGSAYISEDGGANWGIANTYDLGFIVYITSLWTTQFTTTTEALDFNKTEALLTTISDIPSSIILGYEISLDGGSTWNVVSIDDVKAELPAGNSLKLRVTATYDGSIPAIVSLYGYGVALGGA